MLFYQFCELPDYIFIPLTLLQTRFFVTNSISFLPETDRIVVLRNGRIDEMGSYQELLGHRGAFSEFISTYLKETEEEPEAMPDES